MTRAARALGVTQPALSAAVKKLEAEAGSPLLHRTGKGVELTDAGKLFLQHAEESLRAADNAMHAVRQLMGLERGSIRVGGGATAVTYLLPPVVSAIRKKHPGLRFYIREAGSSAVAAAVLAGELDLGIVTLPLTMPGEDELVRVHLVEDELRLIVPPGHSLSTTTPQLTQAEKTAPPSRTKPTKPKTSTVEFSWKDIQHEPFVAFEAGTAVRELIDRAANESGVTLSVVMELRSIESIKSMVNAGIGVGLVSRFALDHGAGLACKDSRLSRRLAIVRRRDRTPSAAAAAFEQRLRELAGQRKA